MSLRGSLGGHEPTQRRVWTRGGVDEGQLSTAPRPGEYIPLDVYERPDGGGGGGEEALAQIPTRGELDNENSPRQIFPLKDLLRLSVMSQ